MANVIKAIRTLNAKTQEETARAIGIHARTFCIKEQNPDLFTVGEIKRIAKFFNVKEEIFFKTDFAFKAT